MATNTEASAERLRVHCSRSDLERWKGAALRSGAGNFSAWVRWVLDKESALEAAAARNPWVDRKTGRARQGQLGLGANQLGRGAKKAMLRGLAEESEGL